MRVECAITRRSLSNLRCFLGLEQEKGGRGEVSNDLLRADSVSYFGPAAEMRCKRGRNFRPGDKH